MKAPLDIMILRRAELDSLVTLATVTDRLSTAASPIGGAYGNTRSAGHKWHNGWDLYAKVGTQCYAITPGEIVAAQNITGYGRSLVLKLTGAPADAVAQRHGVKAIYALYAHLSSILIRNASVMEGAAVALSGADGNAKNTPPHLHFEIRTTALPKKGLHDSIDPAELLGAACYSSRGDDAARVKAVYGIR